MDWSARSEATPPIYTRTLYWTGLFWLGVLILWPGILAAIKRGAERGIPPGLAAGATLILGCVPLAAAAAAGCSLFWPVHASGIQTFEWYGLTMLIAAPSTVTLLSLERVTVFPAEAATVRLSVTERKAAQRSAITDQQLALALCLQMEDHHVRLHMPGRSILCLASLRDTMARTASRDGLQVHRSWWVARDAVAGWVQDGRCVRLILTNGLRVPVARNRVPLLRAAGWLET